MLPPKEVAPDPCWLAGLRVLVTRTAAGASVWADALEAAGARALIYPTIRTVAVPDLSLLDRHLQSLATFDGVIFTSVTAVDITLSRPEICAGSSLRGGTLRASPSLVVAVGASTASALQTAGWPPTLIPSDQRQEGIVEALPANVGGKRFLFPHAAGARELLRDQLRDRGAVVEAVPIYETVACRPLPPLPPFDVALFASPSALRSFADWHGVEVLGSLRFVVLGPTTAAAARALGVSPLAEAAEPSLPGVIAALATSLV